MTMTMILNPSTPSVRTAPSLTTDGSSISTRRADRECQDCARDYLVALIGAEAEDLCWDSVHHLQGHAHWGGAEIVVIAPRDDLHETIVLTASDWDWIRRSTFGDRSENLRTCAIGTHDRFNQAFAAA